jgi:DNA-binding LacI/PurR family transcriptional regulator
VKKVTSYDIARLAGVSQSTVSRAFNRENAVSQETLERIQGVATRMGYRPNEVARSLISRKSNVIGVVMGDILNPFYPAVLHTFTYSLQRLGRRVMLLSVPAGRDVDEVLPQLMQYQVAGVLITSATLSSRMAEIVRRSGTPVVLFNRTVHGHAVNSVCCANEEAAQLVALRLLQAGHKRFGMIGGVARTSTHIERKRAFAKELRRQGITEMPEVSGRKHL